MYRNVSSFKPYVIIHFQLDTVIHEMLHAMGGEHEQSREDRNKHVKLNWDNMDKNDAHNNFLQPTKNDVPYDLSSIMQYGLWVRICTYLSNKIN